MSKERVIIPKITKHPDFKTVYASGIFGSVNPIEGRMTFYIDRIIPKMKTDGLGEMETGEVERELQIEVHVSPSTFVSIRGWMNEHIKKMKEIEKEIKELEKKKKVK